MGKINYKILEEEHHARLPSSLCGLIRHSIKAYPKEKYICHVYTEQKKESDPNEISNISMYFFYFPVSDEWQAGVCWAEEDSQFFTDRVKGSWSAAYRLVRNKLRETSEIDFLLTKAKPGELTPEQIVTIMLAE